VNDVDLFASTTQPLPARDEWTYSEAPRRFELTIPGEPVAKGRGRIIKLGAHMGIKTPEKTRRYEDIVRQTAVREWGYRQPLADVAVTATIRAYRGIAPSWPNKKRALALAGSLRPTGRPDLDNFIKSATDGLFGVVLADDSIIVAVHAEKWYAAEPRLELVLMW
jgi:Holliday junction resolvase RusA-like endonuclease